MSIPEADLMGLLEVTSDIMIGVTVEISDVFTEPITINDWSNYDSVTPA